jgi:glycosyltransferase involved in cell wall biosynthesis
MLKKGALSGKPVKKKVYLAFLRFSGLLNRAYWHATNQEEADNIALHFPRNKGIVTASNIPKVPFPAITFPVKPAGELKLISLSLINEHKNILLLLQMVSLSEANIQLDIYGPVTDVHYWKKCEVLINGMPGRFRYMGEVEPGEVQCLLSQYHALILLTKGENFGHSIYESFSVGRPVITSRFTPWNDLEAKRSGANVDISNDKECLQQLKNFCNMQPHEFNLLCENAHKTALTYFANIDSNTTYQQLFI